MNVTADVDEEPAPTHTFFRAVPSATAAFAARYPLPATAVVVGLVWVCYCRGYLARDNWRRCLARVGEMAGTAMSEHRMLSDDLLVVEPPLPRPASRWPPGTSRAAAGPGRRASCGTCSPDATAWSPPHS